LISPDIPVGNEFSLRPFESVLIKGKNKGEGKVDPECSRSLRFPDFMTTAQDDGKISALRNVRLYPRKYTWYLFLLQAESTPGP